MHRQWILLAILPATVALAQDVTGTWQGTVKNPDTKQELRTVLKISSSEGNPIKAKFYSIDQTYLVFPATLTRQGAGFKVSIPGIGATYEAKLAADRNSMTGTLRGFSIPVQWTMKRVSEGEEWPLPKPPAAPKPLASADPAFEVASIKLTPPEETRRGTRVQGGNVSAFGVTLESILRQVYDVHPHQIIGAPAWLATERYDITAKAEGEGQPNQDQLKIMFGKLMADRFHLAFHKEQRELPVFSLTAAKGGSKISKNDPKNPTFGIIFRGPGSVLFNNASMDDFCRMLQNAAVDRPVVNQTGISGKYDFSLVWTPEQAQAAVPNPNALAPSDRADIPPDLYGAVQQQLGLKLESARLRIEVLIIDKLEKPSDN